MRRNTDGKLLELVRGIVHDVQMAHQRITLRVDRNENQINNRIAIQNERIHDVILVVANRQRGRQGRYETIEEHIHIVVVYIHFGENGVHRLFQCLSRHDLL